MRKRELEVPDHVHLRQLPLLAENPAALPEKTLADCFKYRNKIGMDVVLEALRTWRRRRGASMEVVLKYGIADGSSGRSLL